MASQDADFFSYLNIYAILCNTLSIYDTGVTMEAVEAVKSKEHIDQIQNILKFDNNELYSDLWKVGLNLSLRISDLISLKYEQLNQVDPENRTVTITEGKTGKSRELKLNNTVMEIIKRRYEANPDDEYLFQSKSPRNRSAKPISRVSVARVFKKAGEKHKPRIKLSTHSMRKTRGYFMWVDGVPLERISKILNHSHPAVTMRYIGIEKDDVLASYDEYEL